MVWISRSDPRNFTEQYILGELYAQVLAGGGFSVEKKLDLGSEQIADKARFHVPPLSPMTISIVLN